MPVLVDDRLVEVQLAAQGGQAGGIIDKTMPIRASKVAVWNPSGTKGDRVGVKTLNDGRKVRFFKSNGEMIDA